MADPVFDPPDLATSPPSRVKPSKALSSSLISEKQWLADGPAYSSIVTAFLDTLSVHTKAVTHKP